MRRTLPRVRRISPTRSPEEVARGNLIDAANEAPSGSNTQIGRHRCLHDRAQKGRHSRKLNTDIFKALYRALGKPRRGISPHQSEAARARILGAVQWQAEHFADSIPAHIIACLEFGAPPPDKFVVGAGAGGSIWPGVQNLLLAARALGLAATPTTFAISDRAAAKRVLGLPDTIEPFCLIPVGYPLGKFGPVTRQAGRRSDALGPVVLTLWRWDRWS